MASEILIRQAEKMYGSEFDTTDYTKLLFDPAIAAMKENIEKQRIKTDEFMALYPEGIDLAEVNEKLHPEVTTWSIEQKKKYIKAADIAGGIDDTTDPRYIKAQEEMNQVIRAFERLDTELNGENSLGVKMRKAKENKDNIAGGVDLHHEGDMHLFINGDIIDRILEQGIGDDGTLSYVSHEQTSNKDKIEKLETELAKIEESRTYLNESRSQKAANALVKEIQNLKESRTGIIKKVNQYAGHPKHNTDNVSLVLAVQQQNMNNATGGMVWDDDSTELAVDQIINKMGADGVRDFMFKYKTYIDGYIENTFKLEKGSTEFEIKKEELRNTDLTDEFRESLLGVLKKDHKKYYKPPKGKIITPPTTVTYTAGNTTYEFKYEATTDKMRNNLQLVQQTLDGDPVIVDHNSGITYTLGDGPDENKYYPPQQYEAKAPEDDGYPGQDLTKPLPRIGYTGGFEGTLIQQFGGVMQPTEVWREKTVEEKIIEKNTVPPVPTMSDRNKRKMDITHTGQPADGWVQSPGTSLWSPPTGDGLGNDVQGAVWVKKLPPTEEAWEGKYYRAIDKGVYVFKSGKYILVKEELDGEKVTIRY